MCKVSQFCNVGSHAQQMCHTPSLMYIYTGKVGENKKTIHLTSSSLILENTSYLEDEFSHTWEGRRGQTVRLSCSTIFRC